MAIHQELLAKSHFSEEDIEKKDALIGEKNSSIRIKIENLKIERELKKMIQDL